MANEDFLKDLASIKGMMEQRVRFRALSGLSGILAGVYALLGAVLAHRIVYRAPSVLYYDLENQVYSPQVLQLFALAGGIMYFKYER